MMRSGLVGLAAGLTLAIGATAADAQIDYAGIEFAAEKLSPNLWLLTGSAGPDKNHQDAAGGRIGVLAGPEGVLMVDSQYTQVSQKVLAAVRRISTAPIRFLVNTHIHIDHTGGNAFFAKQGAVIYAREELRDEMLHQPQARDPAGLPSVTYGMGPPVTINVNGETVDFIPVRAAHTGGDTMIRFEKANVIMIGDFYRNFGYPYIDTANGGSLKGMLEALDQTLRIARTDTKLVPGHGTIITREDLVPYRNMILEIRDRVQQMIGQGASLQDVLAAKVTAPFDAQVPGGLLPAGALGTSADRFVTEVYDELKKSG